MRDCFWSNLDLQNEVSQIIMFSPNFLGAGPNPFHPGSNFEFFTVWIKINPWSLKYIAINRIKLFAIMNKLKGGCVSYFSTNLYTVLLLKVIKSSYYVIEQSVTRLTRLLRVTLIPTLNLSLKTISLFFVMK